MIFSLITNLEQIDIILASASPRRYELLQTAGLNFKVVPSEFDESSVNISDPVDYVKEVSRQKGKIVSWKYPDHLVISADTIVVIEDKILGKPEHEDNAFEMLKLLSGKTHLVYTAFSLFIKSYEKEHTSLTSTEVTFRKLKDEEILAYINTGEPFDKAGAYAIQGQGQMLVEKINGCYSNIVGFPLASFFTELDNFLEKLAL